MLQAHSLLWHYLWLAPNALLLIIAFLMWRSELRKAFPAFFAFALFSAVGEFALYAADVLPSVTAENFWRIEWASLLIEGSLKFVLVAEIFSRVFGSYDSVARLGRILIRAAGTALVLAAALAAAYAPRNMTFGIVSGAHLLSQTIYLIVSGLLLSIFLLSAYFGLRPSRPVFGMALGFAISSCVHLATWAVSANTRLPASGRVVLDFVDMATYHAVVLIWFYYLLVPSKVAASPAVPLPENNLEVWNRELERLVQR
jgi:disulfide bond formation protein DsbB